MIDCILCIMPFIRDVNVPLLAPFLLKSILTKNGFTSKVIDINKDLCSFLGYDDYEGEFFSEWPIQSKNDKVYTIIKPFIKSSVSSILEYNPRVIGLSLMAHISSIITEMFCEEIRKQNKDVIISIGGSGADFCGEKLLEKGLIDAYVLGDGETPIINIMNNDFTSLGINGNGRNIEQINSLPFAEYPKDRKYGMLNIQGSRGCIGKCTFCNVNGLFGNYRNRSGKLVAQEMIYQYSIHKTKKFLLIDNAINISSKFINDLCDTLLDKYEKIPFTWIAHAIAKSNIDFKKLKNSGCERLMVGIESGSQKIINDMNKGINLDEALTFIFHCISSEIKLKLYFTTGYPTETQEDFQKSIELIKYLQLIYGNKIQFRVVSDIIIWKDSLLYKNHKDYNINLNDESFRCYKNWSCKNNNVSLRNIRYEILREHCNDISDKNPKK